MEPNDNGDTDAQEHHNDVPVSHREVEHIKVPLTVISGYAQLLQRRIRHGQFRDHVELLRLLAHIERAVRLIGRQVESIADKAHRDRPDADQQ